MQLTTTSPLRIKIICLLLFVLTFGGHALAQTAKYDTAGVLNAARRNAQMFRLRDRDLKRVKQEHFIASSDYFKPNSHNTNNSALLHDSLYVQTFRNTAFYVAMHQVQLPAPGRSLLLPPSRFDPFQAARPVYTKPNEQRAQIDAGSFSLSHDQLARFKAEKWPNTSNYFNPTPQTASNPALLTDSTYVQTFRQEAFYKSYKTRLHPGGHIFLIAAVTAIGATLVVIFLVALSHVQAD